MDTQFRESFWRACVSEALQSLGGEAELQDIYLWIEDADYLGEQDKESWTDGRPMYQHSVRAFIGTMLKSGELVRVSRGRYRLP